LTANYRWCGSCAIAEGKTTKEIADTSNIAFKTVDTHRTNLRPVRPFQRKVSSADLRACGGVGFKLV
jgi:FixJ family two-component response regulator